MTMPMMEKAMNSFIDSICSTWCSPYSAGRRYQRLLPNSVFEKASRAIVGIGGGGVCPVEGRPLHGEVGETRRGNVVPQVFRRLHPTTCPVVDLGQLGQQRCAGQVGSDRPGRLSEGQAGRPGASGRVLGSFCGEHDELPAEVQRLRRSRAAAMTRYGGR